MVEAKDWKFLKQQCELGEAIENSLIELNKEKELLESIQNFPTTQTMASLLALLQLKELNMKRAVDDAITKYLRTWKGITTTDVKKLTTYNPDRIDEIVGKREFSYKTLIKILNTTNEILGYNDARSSRIKYNIKDKDATLEKFSAWLKNQSEDITPDDVDSFNIEENITTEKQRKKAEKAHGNGYSDTAFAERLRRSQANVDAAKRAQSIPETIEERLSAGIYYNYDLLGVSNTTSKEEIKKLGKKYKQQFHPDKPNGSTERFNQIVSALEACGV